MVDENEGMCQYELDRLARIAENKKRMQEMGIFALADSLIKTCTVAKKPAKPRAKKVYVDAGPVRQSDRQRNKPAVNYSDDYRLERIERQPKTGGRQQRRMPVGAKLPNFPIQSAAAIKLATEAAQAKCEELSGRGFYKEMQPSNVSSGYWLQLPVDMGTTYRFSHTADIELECLDECKNIEGWQYEKYPGKNKNRWHVRWLVRGGNSCGLSGGWRGFSIDQQLTWNDTVVFEIPADVPAGELPTYVIIHTYRAENYETAETEGLVVPAKEVFEALLAKMPKEEGEDASDEEGAQEGTPADSPDGDQAAGEDKAAGKDTMAALRARKKRIAEVAGSLKTAAAEHKRQKKAAAAPTKPDAAADEVADKDMAEADGADNDDSNKEAEAAAVEGADDGAAAAAPKRKRGTKNAQTEGKENVPKRPARKAAQEGKAKAAAAAAAPKKEKAPAKRKEAEPEEKSEAEEEDEAVEIKEGEFFVRRVMAARKLSTSTPEFLISWYNYSAEHDSWEPLECLNDCPLTYRWASAAAKTAAQKYASKWVRPE